MAVQTAIPKRQVFKPAEVCSIAGVKPFILRSWEAEFPTLARPKKKGGARVYRRGDVEMVLQIKELVFGEGLTLGAARRKLEADAQPPTEAEPDDGLLAGLFEADVRERIEGVKQGLREVLALLSANGQEAVSPVTEKRPATAKRARRARKSAGVSATKAKKVAKRKRSA